MKLHAMELPSLGKKKALQYTPKIVLLLTLYLILHTLVTFCYPLSSTSFLWKTSPPSSSSSSRAASIISSYTKIMSKTCDISRGGWVPNPGGPYYTNATCWAIHDHQNCMRNGRPDTDFLKWRWQPDECELPLFDAAQFLELVRGKSLAFVGDSVARNQMQSLICLLQRVAYPIDVSYTQDDKFKRLKYTNYDFTLASFWSPHLVRAKVSDANGPTLDHLYLDEFDEQWTAQIEEFNYVIISSGHWFFRPSMMYVAGQVVGCNHCLKKNVTDLNMFYAYRKAFRTAFRALNDLKKFKGMVFLRTFSPQHFENGSWNEGGNCDRKRPFKRSETQLEGHNMELYKTQVEEFRAAERKGEKRGLKYRLLDTTRAMLVRPDGHPNHYGHLPNENKNFYNDCAHWCLPGPIDAWNDFLLYVLKMESEHGDEKFYQSERKLKIR
ncbi:protein trichome birefringence-like 19 [Tasmannia lanceolata]|uniref:protein trichome birefringence-like 19 n=1 Tax=Tasmannia lanceolata TaxID=3420 RepID=UPI004063769B